MNTVASQLNQSLQIDIGEVEAPLKERRRYPAIMSPSSTPKFSTENLELASFHSFSVAALVCMPTFGYLRGDVCLDVLMSSYIRRGV